MLSIRDPEPLQDKGEECPSTYLRWPGLIFNESVHAYYLGIIYFLDEPKTRGFYSNVQTADCFVGKHDIYIHLVDSYVFLNVSHSGRTSNVGIMRPTDVELR